MSDFKQKMLAVAIHERMRLLNELKEINEAIKRYGGDVSDPEPKSVRILPDQDETILSAIREHPGLKVGELVDILGNRGLPIETTKLSGILFRLKGERKIRAEKRNYFII